MNKKKRKHADITLPELLAPVGGWLQLVAAVNNGADAVYMGGSLFNARIKADNFRGEELKRAIDYAHERNVKVYITFNTLIRERELEKAFDYACDLYDAGADAVILQDMGLARLIHKYLPDFAMHLSTQGTVYNAQALDLVREMGFKRVVPARELTLAEIEKLCAASAADSDGTGGFPMEVEVFVHGALCMCYSGQCQMSRLLGATAAPGQENRKASGRSGNRGLCAQPCRLPYVDEKGMESYALSPKDICTIEKIPQLVKAGVDSFKIEGRLKSAEYVAVVTGIYRKYLDQYAEQMQQGKDPVEDYIIDEADYHKLTQIFNRGGFCTGYLDGNPGQELLSGHSPKNQGVRIGEVVAWQKVKGSKRAAKRYLVDVKLDAGSQIRMGDGVEFAGTGNVATYLEMVSDTAVQIGDFDIKGSKESLIGTPVYKVTDRALLEEAAQTFAGEAGEGSDRSLRRKTPVKMLFEGHVGATPSLIVTADDGPVRVSSDTVIENALRRPTDPERISRQLAKLGGTPFEAENIEVNVDSGAMIPISLVNELRRHAVELLLAGRRDTGRLPAARECKELQMQKDVQTEESCEDCHTLLTEADSGKTDKRQQEARRCDCHLVPLEQFMAGAFAHERAVPYVLNVSKGALDEYIEKNFDEIAEAVHGTGIVLGNPGWIRQFQKAGVKVYGDYGLNVYNSQSAKAFAEMGVELIAWSDELSDDGRHVLADAGGVRLEGIKREPAILERVPLMITEHPLQSDYLTDRKGVKHPVFKWYSGDKYLIF